MTQRKIFEKIVSGGQTGANQGALDATLELGHPCGGWCPKGRKSELGTISDKYPVTEHDSGNYVVRTEANVQDSDGSLIFTHGEPTGGTRLTVDMAIKHNKPHYIFDLEVEVLNQSPEILWEWGLDNDVFVLNVAGPRESKNPGTQVLVKAIMLGVLGYARKCYGVGI